MATANELFAANGEDYIVIDSDLRTMTFPASVNNIGVENDKDVHKLNFKMPRYFSGYDLSTFNIRINYLNAQGDGDMYVVTDPTVEDDAIYFSWLVGRHACLYRGAVTFIICLKLADGEGDVAQEFNTTLASLQVLPGLETEPTILENDYDIIEQLLLTVQDTNSKIKAVLDSGMTAEELGNIAKEQKTLKSRMDEFASLPDGSTAGDAELIDIRVGVDGTTYESAGDAVRGQVNDLKEDLSIISEHTSNLFNVNTIRIGTGAGGGSTPTRALSELIYVPDGAYVQAVTLPPNIKYDVEFYKENVASPSTLAGSSYYMADNSIYHYTESYPYIGILFAGTDNRALTKKDLEGVQLRVSYKFDGANYIEHITAVDDVMRSKLKMLMDANAAIELVSEDLNSTMLWEEGSIQTNNGADVYVTGRFRSKGYIPTNVATVLTDGSNGVFVLAYDNGVYVGALASGDVFVTNGTENRYTNIQINRLAQKHPTYRFRLVVSSRDGTDTTLEEASAISITNALKNPMRIKVIQYNIGKFNMGNSGGLSTNVEEKIANYKEFFANQDADLLFMEEFADYIDSSETYQANSTLFEPIFKSASYEEKETVIKSQYLLNDTKFSYLHTSGDPSAWCIYGNTCVNGNTFAVVASVLNVTANTDQKIRALTKLTDTLLTEYDNVIIGMDTNALSKTEADAIKTYMIDKGYSCGNWDYLGYKETYNLSTSMYKAIDNIFVKGNAKIINFSVPNVYDELSSDHFPVVADIAVY